ncbi:MAG: hypothetical protein ACREQJ_07490, partial [Candidatus Binatia bacterium]
MRRLAFRSPLVVALLALALAACDPQNAKAPQPTPATAAAAALATPEGPRLPIDPQTSPVEFQWLASDSVLVAPEVAKRDLAEFGNYLSRAAKSSPEAELSVYTDAEAWQADQAEPQREVPKRAEYEKHAGANAIERFAVLDADGNVVYERDFRNYPLAKED